MAKVAAPGTVPSNPLPCGGGALMADSGVRRKTPSELRGEQLKRRNVIELVGESSTSSLGSTSEVNHGLKKPEPSKNPRYVDTRMNEVYPVKKPRFRTLPGKDNNTKSQDTSVEKNSSLNSFSKLTDLAAKRRHQLSSTENSVAPAKFVKDGMVQARHTIEKCSQSTFRGVTELSSSGERFSGLTTVDMDKVLKGLVAHELPSVSGVPTNSSETFGDPTSAFKGNFCSDCHISGQNAPLDFTLKTSMRVVTSSSVNWLHRMSLRGTSNGLMQSTYGSNGVISTANTYNFGSLHSWVYPQSSLPPSLISVLKLSTDGVETDFLRKRQLVWEDSFRSLYYMLRKSVCDLFYVCTSSHFVVMFTAGDDLRKSKRSCNAYISQSTKGMRSSLREHDVCFSMPLCRSKIEQVTSEDLVELSEIEKNNLGQTRRRSSMPDVDNSPQSLLAFSGNESVQGLYDFMLNYRSLITSLTSDDVPVLYSPVPFQNAALSSPEVRCMEMKRTDHVVTPKGSNARDGESVQGSSPSLLCSIEIKDAYLPPWIICAMCTLVRPEGNSFEASFTTEPSSIGLNVAIRTVKDNKSDPEGGVQGGKHTYGIPEATISPHLSMGPLKSLKYSDGSYIASLSPV